MVDVNVSTPSKTVVENLTIASLEIWYWTWKNQISVEQTFKILRSSRLDFGCRDYSDSKCQHSQLVFWQFQEVVYNCASNIVYINIDNFHCSIFYCRLL